MVEQPQRLEPELLRLLGDLDGSPPRCHRLEPGVFAGPSLRDDDPNLHSTLSPDPPENRPLPADAASRTRGRGHPRLPAPTVAPRLHGAIRTRYLEPGGPDGRPGDPR